MYPMRASLDLYLIVRILWLIDKIILSGRSKLAIEQYSAWFLLQWIAIRKIFLFQINLSSDNKKKRFYIILIKNMNKYKNMQVLAYLHVHIWIEKSRQPWAIFRFLFFLGK